MQKHIMGENGISYTLGEDGMYYPDLILPEETNYTIRKYGRMRGEYLREYRKGLYLDLVLDGKLNEHLHQTDEECYMMMERLVEQMKAENQMLWVGMCNNIRHSAEEVVLKEIVYA